MSVLSRAPPHRTVLCGAPARMTLSKLPRRSIVDTCIRQPSTPLRTISECLMWRSYERSEYGHKWMIPSCLSCVKLLLGSKGDNVAECLTNQWWRVVGSHDIYNLQKPQVDIRTLTSLYWRHREANKASTASESKPHGHQTPHPAARSVLHLCSPHQAVQAPTHSLAPVRDRRLVCRCGLRVSLLGSAPVSGIVPGHSSVTGIVCRSSRGNPTSEVCGDHGVSGCFLYAFCVRSCRYLHFLYRCALNLAGILV